MERKKVDVAVIGGGPAGLTAAIALASAGVETALVSKAPPADNRTTALLSSSVAALDALGVWPLCAAQAAPLTAIRIIDDTSRLLRAPEVMFEAAEIGLEAFGHNIENRHLIAALDRRAAELGALSRIAAAATEVKTGGTEVAIQLDDGSLLGARLDCGRRWADIAVPPGCRDRGRAARIPAGGADPEPGTRAPS